MARARCGPGPARGGPRSGAPSAAFAVAVAWPWPRAHAIGRHSARARPRRPHIAPSPHRRHPPRGRAAPACRRTPARAGRRHRSTGRRPRPVVAVGPRRRARGRLLLRLPHRPEAKTLSAPLEVTSAEVRVAAPRRRAPPSCGGRARRPADHQAGLFSGGCAARRPVTSPTPMCSPCSTTTHYNPGRRFGPMATRRARPPGPGDPGADRRRRGAARWPAGPCRRGQRAPFCPSGRRWDVREHLCVSVEYQIGCVVAYEPYAGEPPRTGSSAARRRPESRGVSSRGRCWAGEPAAAVLPDHHLARPPAAHPAAAGERGHRVPDARHDGLPGRRPRSAGPTSPTDSAGPGAPPPIPPRANWGCTGST